MTKKYDLFMEALEHLCEVHEVDLCIINNILEVSDTEKTPYFTLQSNSADYTKESL